MNIIVLYGSREDVGLREVKVGVFDFMLRVIGVGSGRVYFFTDS